MKKIERQKAPPKPRVIGRLLCFLKPHQPWLVITVVISMAGAALGILSALYLGKLSDRAGNMDLQGFAQALIPMIIVLLLQIPINYLKTYCPGRYSEYSLYDIREKTAAHIQRLQVSYMDRHPSGDLMSRLSNDVNLLQQFLQGSLSSLISEPLTFAASVTFLFIISFKLSLVSFTAIPVFMILTMLMSKPIEKFTGEQQEALAEVNVIAQDMISGMPEAKSFRLEEPIAKKFDVSVDNAVKKGLAVSRVQAMIGPVSNMMQMVPFILIFAYGGYLVINNEMSFGALIAFINLTNSVVNPMGTLPRAFGALRSAAAAGGRILEIWDEPEEVTGSGAVDPSEYEDAIRFENVSFSYGEANGEANDDTKPFIRDLSFSVAPGETYALVGPSGCGKSTLLKLVTGFYRIQSGDVKIFGRSMRDWDIRKLRERIAWVSQDTYLFPGSIYENIAYGKQGASAEEIYHAAQAANIHDYILSLPEKYDTQVGERGVKLSGGQRQRLSIARAILKDAPILLLDEATSALDVESEHQVQTALNDLMRGRTTLVVAHRLSTVKAASVILAMEEGAIAERGTHEELLERGRLYKRLYLKQMAAEASQEPENSEYTREEQAI